MKKIGAVVLLLVAVAATVPWWGGCDLNAQICRAGCGVKNFNSDVKTAGCRASCYLESAKCRGGKAAKEVGNFMNSN